MNFIELFGVTRSYCQSLTMVYIYFICCLVIVRSLFGLFMICTTYYTLSIYLDLYQQLTLKDAPQLPFPLQDLYVEGNFTSDVIFQLITVFFIVAVTCSFGSSMVRFVCLFPKRFYVF